MKLPQLTKGNLIKRYKRFLADVRLENGEIVTAHVPNSGKMTACIEDNCEVFLSYHDNPKRKLKYTLELTCINNYLICTNTNHANKVGFEAIKNSKIKELIGYKNIKTEQKYGKNSRIDILLENDNQQCFVEIKSVTLRVDDFLAFPDAITARGTKHLDELIQMKKQNHRAVMLYIAQRQDTNKFRIANEIDKTYYQTLQKAIKSGVEVLVYQSKISLDEITIDKKLEFTKN